MSAAEPNLSWGGIFVILIVVVGTVGILLGCSNADEPYPDVLINGKPYTSILVVDKKQGKSWRAVQRGHALLILPGSEQTLPVEKP